MSKKEAFYTSDQWRKFRLIRIDENIRDHDGVLTCEYCKQPINDASKCHIHHKIELNEDNVCDPLIALSSENTMCLHHECHNIIHSRYTGTPNMRKVYLVYGAPCSEKEEYVDQHAKQGDLIVSIDRITKAIAGQGIPSHMIDPVIFKIRSALLDCIRRRIGTWSTAWIIEGAPSRAKRAELCRVYHAEPVYIESTQEDCLQRRKESHLPEKMDEYIIKWFEEFKK